MNMFLFYSSDILSVIVELGIIDTVNEIHFKEIAFK